MNAARNKDKKKPQPLFQQAQIVARSSEDGIDCIAFRSFQVISFQMAIVFHMSDDRLDCVSSSRLTFDISRLIVGDVMPRVLEMMTSSPSRSTLWPR